MNIRDSARLAVYAIRVGGYRTCCIALPNCVVSMRLKSEMRLRGPATWIHPPFIPGTTRLSSAKASSAFSVSQRKPVSGSNAIPKPLRWP